MGIPLSVVTTTSCNRTGSFFRIERMAPKFPISSRNLDPVCGLAKHGLPLDRWNAICSRDLDGLSTALLCVACMAPLL